MIKVEMSGMKVEGKPKEIVEFFMAMEESQKAEEPDLAVPYAAPATRDIRDIHGGGEDDDDIEPAGRPPEMPCQGDYVKLDDGEIVYVSDDSPIKLDIEVSRVGDGFDEYKTVTLYEIEEVLGRLSGKHRDEIKAVWEENKKFGGDDIPKSGFVVTRDGDVMYVAKRKGDVFSLAHVGDGGMVSRELNKKDLRKATEDERKEAFAEREARAEVFAYE